MAKQERRTKGDNRTSYGALAALGFVAVGAAAAAYFNARKTSADNDSAADFSRQSYADEYANSDADEIGEIDSEEMEVVAMTTPITEPMSYTGRGTPDMAVSYVPGLDGSEDRMAGDESSALGTAEQRDAMAGTLT